MAKVTAIIQARMGSGRLPGKSLRNIGDRTLIEWVIDRLLLSKEVEQIVLATTSRKEDEELSSYVKQKYPKIKIFRGHSKDVLRRYYKAAIKFRADPIVRITADDPFKDPGVIDQIVKEFKKGGHDYISNTLKPTYPEGIDIEVLSFEALEKAYSDGRSEFDREHVTYFVWNNPQFFKIKNVEASKNISDIRLTVDYKEDLELADQIAKHFKKRFDFSYLEIVDYLLEKRELLKLNSHIKRYESLNK